MTTPKCPLCGNEYYFETFTIDKDTYICPQCKICKYRLEMGDSRATAEKNIEEFISKFPPIMRLKVGDKLTYFNNLYDRQNGIVLSVDTASMRILMESGDDPTSEMIIKWPWELEEEGGRQ